MNIVLAQRLVRKLHKIKEKYILSKAELVSLGKIVNLDRILKMLREENVIGKNDSWDTINFYKPKESAESKDGYTSRVGIHEVMKMTPSIRELIIKGATSQQIEEQSKKEGMITMLEDGIFKSAMGLTTIEEVLRVVSE